MNMDNLTLGDIKELIHFFNNKQSQQATQFNGEFRIVVFQFGWVFVGELYTLQNGEIELRNAKNIRRWGTDEGIFQLRNGPLPETKLDNHADIKFFQSAGVFTIETEKTKWL